MKKLGLAEQEAEEEEEEELVKGLEDFGFGAINPAAAGPNKGDAEEDEKVELREDDFENIVDQLSDGEGDDKAFQDYARNEVGQHAQRSPCICLPCGLGLSGGRE